MLFYSLKRILWIIPTIICVSLIIYTLMDLAPGTIVDSMITDDMTQDDIAALRAKFDLDKPMLYRYGKYMLNLMQGDLGTSQITGLSVWNQYITRFPRTLQLALSSLVLGVAVSIPLGIFAAKHAGSIWDNLTTLVALVGISMPAFWIGLLLLFAFSYHLRIFPTAYDGTFASFVLPTISSGFLLIGSTTRQTRSAMLEVMRQDYLRTARAKGVSESGVTVKHALRNALIPIITTVGMMLANTISGSAIVESVYSWPGIGRLVIEAITARDTTLACGGVILTLILYILMLLVVDLLYALVDPRIRSQYTPIRKRRKRSA